MRGFRAVIVHDFWFLYGFPVWALRTITVLLVIIHVDANELNGIDAIWTVPIIHWQPSE